MNCFCGCGGGVSPQVRSINKDGARLRRDLGRIQLLLDRGMKSPGAHRFVEQAREWCGVLAAWVHMGTTRDDGRPGSVEAFEHWKRETRAYHGQYGAAYLGARMREMGLSENDASRMIAEGGWDPYVGVPPPPHWLAATAG